MTSDEATGARSIRIDALFAGGVSLLGPDQTRTGIVKTAHDRVTATINGIAGDIQVDRRVHGGPDKAVHHFPADHYPALAAAFPIAGALAIPGALGENVSTRGWTEEDVAIGDVYAVGAVRLQVSQPRSPCWKIDARLDQPGVARWIAAHGYAGWYCRVLAPGELEVGSELVLIDRAPGAVSVRAFWRVVQQHRPEAGLLRQLAALPGLAGEWKRRLDERACWREGTADS
jgi:MOSC domain-containing protein YiiM